MVARPYEGWRVGGNTRIPGVLGGGLSAAAELDSLVVTGVIAWDREKAFNEPEIARRNATGIIRGGYAME